jgi:hypothetical protein
MVLQGEFHSSGTGRGVQRNSVQRTAGRVDYWRGIRSYSGELLEREFPGYSEISYEDFALGDEGVAKLRVFEWMPPDGSFPVTQAQLYYVLSARGITSTATTSSVNLAKIKSTLLDVLRFIVVIGDPVPDTVET